LGGIAPICFTVNPRPGWRVFLPTTAPVVLPSPPFEEATLANIDFDPRLTSVSHDFYQQMFDLYNATPGASAAIKGNFNLNDPTGCTGFVGPTTAQGQLGIDLPCAVHFQKTIGTPFHTSLVSGRVDWNIGSNDRAFLQLQYEHGINAYVDAISPLFNVWSSLPTAQGQLNETHILGPTAANQLLLAAWYARGNNSVADPSQTFSAFPTTMFFSNKAFSGLGGMNANLPTPSYGSLTHYQVADDFVKIRGAHKLGLGAIFVRKLFINSFYNSNAVGTLVTQSLDAFFNGGVDSSSPNTDFTTLYQSFSAEGSQRFVNYNLGLYVPVKAILQGHGFDRLVQGWQVSGTVFVHSGLPYTAIDWGESGNLAPNNFGGPIYAVPVGPLGAQGPCGKGAAIPAAPHPCLSNALFVRSGCETGFDTGKLGPSGSCSGSVAFAQGRNHFRGPHYFNTDFTILKNTKIPGWENAVLGIGFQFFNVLNHPNFHLPDNNSSDGTFGQILSMAQPPTSILGALGGDTSARMIQLKVQLQF